MRARQYRFEVLSSRVVGGATLLLRIRSSSSIEARAGQFLSIAVPSGVKRAYSFSNTLSADLREFELCVRLVEGGQGSSYLASLQPGDHFEARAPFGHFVYETSPERAVCFIASGTGIAPLRAMALSDEFCAKERKAPALSIVGYRTELDLIYAGDFSAHGVREFQAISRPQVSDWIGTLQQTGFRGRVTEFLRQSSAVAEWPWLETDFYLCGNGAMIESVRQVLVNFFRVPSSAIRAESYFSPLQGVQGGQTPGQLEQIGLSSRGGPPPFRAELLTRKKVG